MDLSPAATSPTAARRSRPPARSIPLWDVLISASRGAGRSPVAGACACIAGLAALFAPTLGHFVYTWQTDENYSHGFLVPLLGLYFANEAARKGPVPLRGGAVLGGSLLVAALLGRLFTSVVPLMFVGDLSFLLGLAGLVALLAGSRALRRYGFALAFLIFMVPLPVALYSAIASPLQMFVSRVGGAILGLVGIPVLCQGNMMTLPGDVQMFVAEACSGMRQLTGFLALTTAVAYLSNRSMAYRAIVVASAVPIALTANVLRVVLTGLIMYHVNPEFAMGGFHTVEGLLMMGVGLALLAGLCSALNAVFPAPRPATEG